MQMVVDVVGIGSLVELGKGYHFVVVAAAATPVAPSLSI